MLETLHPDVVHYFLAPNVGSAPVAGAEHLARYWRKVTAKIHATWVVDHILDGVDEAVIEWTMSWLPPGEEQPVATRGRGVVRVPRRRSSPRSAPTTSNDPETTELDGFPYPERGYSTFGQLSSAIHQPKPNGDPR